jgi:hypothetical protein
MPSGGRIFIFFALNVTTSPKNPGAVMKHYVPLIPARGYSSMTLLYQEAQKVADLGVPLHVYHFGDYDPSGVNAGENIEKDLREHAPDTEIHFSRIAVTPEQIRRWRLPTRPTR